MRLDCSPCNSRHLQSEAGSLSTGRGWLGFGLAVVALLNTVVYFIVLQVHGQVGAYVRCLRVSVPQAVSQHE